MGAAKKAEGNGTSLAQRASGPLSKKTFTMTVGALEAALLKRFPREDAAEGDHTGLLVGDPAAAIQGVALALDPTVEAIREAQARGANVLVTHHPAYREAPGSFRPGGSVAQEPGAGVWAAVEGKVALMCFHTALDVSQEASKVLPGMLKLQFKGIIEQISSDRRKGYGQLSTVRGSDSPLSLGQLAARCTSVFGKQPRVWGDLEARLTKVATCTGSVGDLPARCLEMNADCLVGGEIRYHDALSYSQAGLAVIELGHDISELPLVAVLAASVEAQGVPQEMLTIIDQEDNWCIPETTRV